MIKSHLSELLGRDKTAINFGLSCTMNADESIARGCALQCAMLSKRRVGTCFQYIFFASEAAPAGNSLNIFAKGDETPKVRRVNFNMDQPFTLTATYDTTAELPAGTSPTIGTFKVWMHTTTWHVVIGVDVPEGAGLSKVRVNVKHDIHGMFNVQSAEMMKEVVKKPPTSNGSAEPDGAAGPQPNGVPPAGAGVPESGDKAADENGSCADKGCCAGQDVGKEDAAAVTKKKAYSKVPLKVDPKTAAWTKTQIDEAVLMEAQMANQDRVLRETADKRNELESYVYLMRDKVVGSLRPYVEGEEADRFGGKLKDAEDWLYSDEGFDSSKSVYTAKLKELTDLGEPIEKRMYEATNRQDCATELQRVIDSYIKFVNSSDEAYAHIDQEEKSKVRDCAKTAEKWLFQKLDQQANFPPSKNPVSSC
ncbi:unnamed protein product, partial [Sphacelaria rigidula]